MKIVNKFIFRLMKKVKATPFSSDVNLHGNNYIFSYTYMRMYVNLIIFFVIFIFFNLELKNKI